jgi:hypothetical protein
MPAGERRALLRHRSGSNIGLAARICRPLDDEEHTLPGFDLLEEDQQELLGRIVPWLARLRYRSQDRGDEFTASSCQRLGLTSPTKALPP